MLLHQVTTPMQTNFKLRKDDDSKSTLLSLKFCLHMATRTQHQQNSNEVTHGTELISQHSRREKTIQSNQKLKGALHQLDARAHAQDKNVLCAHARPTRDCPHKKPRIC
jgi:hypothetical protein